MKLLYTDIAISFPFVSPTGEYVVSILTGFRRFSGGLCVKVRMGPPCIPSHYG